MKTGTAIVGPTVCALICGVGSSIFVWSLVDDWTERVGVSYVAAGVCATGAAIFAVVAALRIDRRAP